MHWFKLSHERNMLKNWKMSIHPLIYCVYYETRKLTISDLLQNLFTNQLHNSKQYCPYERTPKIHRFSSRRLQSRRKTLVLRIFPSLRVISRKSMHPTRSLVRTILFRMMHLVRIAILKQNG